MVAGSYLSGSSFSSTTNIFFKILGTQDLHTHFRIKPLLDYLSSTNSESGLSVVEVGCGDGINLFEISRITKINKAIGFDLNHESISYANELTSKKFGSVPITFKCEDVSKQHGQLQGEYDICLLMDFIEHIDNPKQIIDSLYNILKFRGKMVVSVPTPLYPKVFGRKFNKEVGHVHDGYTVEELCELFGSDFKLVKHSYNTGLLANLGCFIFYRFVRNIKKRRIRFLFLLLIHLLFRPLDIFNGPKVSSTLFAVFERV